MIAPVVVDNVGPRRRGETLDVGSRLIPSRDQLSGLEAATSLVDGPRRHPDHIQVLDIRDVFLALELGKWSGGGPDGIVLEPWRRSRGGTATFTNEATR